MSLFACAIMQDAGRVPDSFRADMELSPYSRGRILEWHAARGFLGVLDVTAGAPSGAVARLGLAIAIGDVRLDNRGDVARWLGESGAELSDLALALRFVLRDDGRRVGQLLGDFAFVVWDPTRRLTIAVRDAFGARKLFVAEQRAGIVTFASRASLLALDDRYDVKYLADRLTQGASDAERTVFTGVREVRPANVLRMRDGRSTSAVHWSACVAQDQARGRYSPAEQCSVFRDLLAEGVRSRLSGEWPVWSQLSGGLDSSSVVCVAQWLLDRGTVRNGLAGTVSYTDSLGTGADERAFSDAVVEMYDLRNELVAHRPEASDFDAPPLLDQPNLAYTVALRDLAAARVIRQAGGRTLLTGEGGDGLVAGTMFFFADWLVTGRARAALREMAHRAAVGRVSFWRLAYENALLPLLPVSARRWLTATRSGSIPPWIPSAAVRRFELEGLRLHDQVYRGRMGCKYSDAAVAAIDAIPSAMPLGPLHEALDVRHPFLHRPLVELSLGLAPEMCVRPHARKWILREAMRGILPEVVRTRVGKGSLDGLNAWWLTHEQARLDRLLDDPILADLGCIDAKGIRTTLADVRGGRAVPDEWRERVGMTLEVELWLRLRSGRWAATDQQGIRRAHVTSGMGGSAIITTGQSSRSTV